MRHKFLLISIFWCFFSYSQENTYKELDVYILIKGDSIASKSIDLKEVTVYPSLDFKNYKDKLKYYTIRRKTLKVYPYAVLASQRLTELNKRLPLIKSRAKKKKYTKVVEKFIEKEFSDELKKLTRTEGQILVKLIHRETGETVYNQIKKIRNGFRAFSYSSLAKLFDISLKNEYNSINIEEDAIIEDVIKRAYADKSIKLSLKND
jgi:hypothetical protein